MRIPAFAIAVVALSVAFGAGVLWQRLHDERKDAVDQVELVAPLPQPVPTRELVPGTASTAAPLPTPPLPAPSAVPAAPRPVLPIPTAPPPRVPVNSIGPEQTMASNDQNGDGIISRSEAEAANKTVIQLWDMYDGNKDGSVDAREVVQANIRFVGMRGQAQRTGSDTIVTSNDKNGDGVVTRDEAAQVNGALSKYWPLLNLNNDDKTDRDEVAKYLEE